MTNKALLYRPSPKSPFVFAFTVALTIHVSAVALASWHHEAPVVPPGTPFTPVDIYDEADLPTPPPIDVPLSEPPMMTEFIEPVQTRRHLTTRVPVVPVQPSGQMRTISNTKGFALHAPRPDYPYEARSRRITGSGVATLHVDPNSGLVLDATMAQSIGNPILDNSAISAFKRWRFKTGTPSKIRIPITFTLTGASY